MPVLKVIEGSKLASKDEADKSGQQGPYLNSGREKLANELILFAKQHIDAKHPKVKIDESTKLIVR